MKINDALVAYTVLPTRKVVSTVLLRGYEVPAFETMVFACDAEGEVTDWLSAAEKLSATREAALLTHFAMVIDPEGELGDVYVADITSTARRIR